MEATLFIPADESKGIEILAALLQVYPVIVTEEATEETQYCAEIQSLPEAAPASVVDLERWIIPAGEIDEVGEKRDADACVIEVSSLQSTFLQ